MFYVYEHWRTDQNRPFYVGKGKGKRAYEMAKRNIHHKNIQKKIIENNYKIEIRIIESNLSEIAAFQLEKARIQMWRHIGYYLANFTNGGDGISGFSHSKETREKMSKSAFLANTDEVKHKKSKSMKGKIKSQSHCEKISLSNFGNKNACGKRPKEFGGKISKALKGRKLTPEHIANRSASIIRNNNKKRGIS